NYQGLIGVVVNLGLAWLMSNNRRRIDWRLVAWGMGLQVLFAVIILRTPIGKPFFDLLNTGITHVVDYSQVGIDFVFEPLNSRYVQAYDVVPDVETGAAGGEGTT